VAAVAVQILEMLAIVVAGLAMVKVAQAAAAMVVLETMAAPQTTFKQQLTVLQTQVVAVVEICKQAVVTEEAEL
jgi:hypothetical protein